MRPRPLRIPVIRLSAGAQLLLLLVGLGFLALMPPLSQIQADLEVRLMAAVICGVLIAFVTFTLLALWTKTFGSIFLFLASMWLSSAAGLGSTATVLLTGLIVGTLVHVAVRNQVREDHLFALIGIALTLSTIGLYTLTGALVGFDAWERMQALPDDVALRRYWAARQALPYGPLGTAHQQQLNETWEGLSTAAWLAPATAVVLLTVLIYVGTRLLRRRLPRLSQRVPPFWTFNVSEFYIYPLILVCLLDAAAIQWDWNALRQPADNVLWFAFHFYVVAGLAVAQTWMLQLQFGRVARLWFWAVLLYLLRPALAGLGLFDTWFHFRRWGARWTGKEKEGS